MGKRVACGSAGRISVSSNWSTGTAPILPPAEQARLDAHNEHVSKLWANLRDMDELRDAAARDRTRKLCYDCLL